MEPDFPPAGHIRKFMEETGLHFATRVPLLPQLTCGPCVHRVTQQLPGGGERTRCELAVARRGGPNI